MLTIFTTGGFRISSVRCVSSAGIIFTDGHGKFCAAIEGKKDEYKGMIY